METKPILLFAGLLVLVGALAVMPDMSYSVADSAPGYLEGVSEQLAVSICPEGYTPVNTPFTRTPVPQRFTGFPVSLGGDLQKVDSIELRSFGSVVLTNSVPDIGRSFVSTGGVVCLKKNPCDKYLGTPCRQNSCKELTTTACELGCNTTSGTVGTVTECPYAMCDGANCAAT